MSIPKTRPGCLVSTLSVGASDPGLRMQSSNFLTIRIVVYGDGDQLECSRCTSRGLECVRVYNVRFRHGSNPSVANVRGSGLSKCEYDFADDQTWCRTPSQLHYIDETQELISNYEGNVEQEEIAAAQLDNEACESSLDRQVNVALHLERPGRPLPPVFDNVPVRSFGNHGLQTKRRRLDSQSSNPDFTYASPERSGSIAMSPISASRMHQRYSFSTASDLDRSAINPDDAAGDADRLTPAVSHSSLSTAISPPLARLARTHLDSSGWTIHDREEAFLMRHFAENVSRSLDLCDPNRHFALVVPHRATGCPILLNAIFACSARYLSHSSDFDPDVSDKYHQECLKHLIPMLSDSAAVMDEDLLAATIILRCFEEVEVTSNGPENESHLLGSHIFISAQESSAKTGGLRQAAFWLGLRQEIYTAYVTQRNIIPALTHCNIDRALGAADDYTWANRIIVHCADVIRYCYGDGHRSTTAYTELVEYCDGWMSLKPPTFSPMFYKEAQEGSFFPEIWLLGDAVVTAVQHYYLSRILLAAHDPNVPRLGPASKTAVQRMDEEIKAYVRIICGIAVSNPHPPPNFVNAMMGVACAGDKFTERKEQEALIDILVKAEMYAVPSQKAQNHLKETWGWT